MALIGAGAAASLAAACAASTSPAPATSAPPPTQPTSAPATAPTGAPAPAATTAGATVAPAVASGASGTLTVVQGADITTTDPFQTPALRGPIISIYDQLLVRDQNFKIAPWLATSWDNPDDTTWVFHLRQGVTFHNGEPFNAASVQWAFQRFVAPEEKNIYASMLGPVTQVDALDDYTVKVTTKDPFPALLENLAYGVFIGPPQAMQAQGDDFFKNPIGSGPFRFISWSPGEKMVVEAAGGHFGGDPQIKTVVWQPVTDDSTRVEELRTGQADLITGVSPGQISRLDGQSGISVVKFPSQSFMVLIMNSSRPPFNDQRVRQAMNYAIDKQALINTLLGGNGTVLPAPAGPAIEGYDPNLGVMYNYDPDKARQLLSDAGYGSGFSVTLDSTDGRYLQDRAVAEAISGMLGKVGIQAQVNPWEWGAFLNLLQAKTSDVFLIQQGGSTTDNLFPAAFSSQIKGLTWLGYSNPQADALINQARTTVDSTARNKVYGDFIRLVQQDAPWVYLYYQTNIFGMRDQVKGFVPRPDNEIIVQPMSVAG
jgi:peptide/nickel transport system substrate-binding protein